ncbi:Olfactory receptor 9I1 [Frankliniella fusca]|uniref:Olfactory receptor 9I1 n=1 Tax=Frankliniella fusca TaxID=407009 RepID=A0AAE1HV33_9NEOP|nr:Olfactory receptor 9I1 [Frankliniella fusca]
MMSFGKSRHKSKRSPGPPVQLGNLDKVLANAFLVVCSVWALRESGGYHERPIVAVTFSTCLMHAVAGVIRYGIQDNLYSGSDDHPHIFIYVPPNR